MSRLRYTDTVSYEPLRIGSEYMELRVPRHWVPRPFPGNPLWRRMHEVFDTEHFLYPAPPVDLGKVSLSSDSLASMEALRVLRCMLKRPGSDVLYVPKELGELFPLIRHCVETERACNPSFEQFSCHVSFERTFVEAGASQRVPGWHVDGFQGVRAPRHRIEHSYLWSDRSPTEYCLQPFFVSHLDPARHNVFDEIERQAIEMNAFGTLENHIYLIDPYVVHRSPVLIESGHRCFFRMTFTETELEDPNNTVNLSIQADTPYEDRLEVRNRLYACEAPVPWEIYGLQRGSR